MEKHYPQHSQRQASFCCAHIPIQGGLWSVVAPREGTLMQTLQFIVNSQCDVLDCPGSCTSVGTRGPGNCRHKLGQIHDSLPGTETELISCTYMCMDNCDDTLCMIGQTHVMVCKHLIANNWQEPPPIILTFVTEYVQCLDSSMLGAYLLKAGFVTANSKSRVVSAAGKIFIAICRSLHLSIQIAVSHEKIMCYDASQPFVCSLTSLT